MGVAVVNHRRTAGRLTLLSVLAALVLWVPGAVALDAVVDTTSVDTTASMEAAPITPVASEPVAIIPAPVPVTPDPIAIIPAPVTVAPPVPTTVVVPVDPTPPPQDVMVAVHDATPVTSTAVADAITVAGSDTATVAARLDLATPTPTGVTNAVDSTAPTTTPVSGQSAMASSVITPLVVPIVQTLGSGLLAPYVRPETFGPQTSAPNTVGAQPTRPAPMPARPAQASSITPFGIAVPTGGWSGHSAGILALLIGLLPLGLPDGKSTLGGPTQLAVLMMGALLMLVPFFASSIRDDRRRGPRGFAALALRPG